MEDKDICCYEFGEFLLDVRRRSLLKSGEKLPLSARNFDLLLFMVENGGRILEHDELLDKVWAGTFVEQATLKKGISALRQTLSATPENEFIKTIPRRGYSFVSPVRAVPEVEESLIVRETEREIIVEEYEETDEQADGFQEAKAFSANPSSVKQLPAAENRKVKLSRLAILTGASLLVIVLAFFSLKPFFSKDTQPAFSAENVRITRITNNGKIVSGTAISPDGVYLLYPMGEKDGMSLWLRQIATNSTTRLTAPVHGGFWSFGIAPDSSYVYYILNNTDDLQKNGLYKIPLLGGEPRRIAENVSTLSISPDGKRIALIRASPEGSRIFTINSEGEAEQTITELPATSRLWGMTWTPDGSALLCTIRKIVEDKMLFYITELPAENGKENIILPDQEKIIFGAAWLPDKSSMLLTVREQNADIRQIWLFTPSTREWRRVTNDNNSYRLLNLTRDGKTIVTSQESRLASIWLSDSILPGKNSADKKVPVINRDNFRQITDGVNSFDKIGWLADGRLIYSVAEDGKEMLFVMNPDGTNARQITNGEDGMWILPSVALNGQSVCFLSSRIGIKQAWRIDSDGKNLTQITNSVTPIIEARIMRDNSTVIYSTQIKSGNTVIYQQKPDGQIVQLIEGDIGSWAISPDEKLLAAEIQDKTTRKFRVELRSLEDGKIIKTFDFLPIRKMSFTPDGKNLAYDTKQEDNSRIMLQPIDGGAPTMLADFQTDVIFNFDWSADGTRLAVIRGKQLTDAVTIKTAR